MSLVCEPSMTSVSSIPNHQIYNLIERVRSELHAVVSNSENVQQAPSSESQTSSVTRSRNVIKTVLSCLAEAVPKWERDMKTLSARLDDVTDSDLDQFYQSQSAADSLESSGDLARLRETFQGLWRARNDEQQRSWPIHEDETVICSQLTSLLQMVSGTVHPVVIRRVIYGSGSSAFDNIHMLTTYFQMEPRRRLRMLMMRIFTVLMIQFPLLVRDYFLVTGSFLASVLTLELTQYAQSDAERWIQASLVFTALFSTGHRPPVSIYEHINEQFCLKQLDMIEGVRAITYDTSVDPNELEFERVEFSIPIEYAIAPLLAFNLHFDCPALAFSGGGSGGGSAGQQPVYESSGSGGNLVLRALRRRRVAAKLTENLISYLNWEEDVTRTCLASEFTARKRDSRTTSTDDSSSMKSNACDESDERAAPQRANAVLKLLIEMLSDPDIARLFYFNDVRVIVDIIIRQLDSLSPGDEVRRTFFSLFYHLYTNCFFVGFLFRNEPLTWFFFKSCCSTLATTRSRTS